MAELVNAGGWRDYLKPLKQTAVPCGFESHSSVFYYTHSYECVTIFVVGMMETCASGIAGQDRNLGGSSPRYGFNYGPYRLPNRNCLRVLLYGVYVSLARRPALGAGGRRFESYHSDHICRAWC